MRGSKLGDRPSSMTERLRVVAVPIDSREPDHEVLVMREGTCAVGSQFWDW